MEQDEVVARMNAHHQALLDKSDSRQEALAWLKQSDGKQRFIGESSENLNPADSRKLVENLYRIGAVEVVAIDIEDDDDMEATSTLIVALPEDAPLRKGIFAIERKVAKGGGFDGTVDQGQRYLMFHW